VHVCKVDARNLVTDLKWTIIFEWSMVGVKLRTNTKNTYVEKKLDYMPKNINILRCSSEHNWPRGEEGGGGN
jgi:hypothetical protein